MNIFTYIQHPYTAIVLCKCAPTYIFSNYYKIHKQGKTPRLPRVRLLHSQHPQRVMGAWGPMASPLPRNIPLLLVKITSFQLYKFFTSVPIAFPIIYSSDPYIQAETRPPCSVEQCLALLCLGMGRHAHSCFNTAVYVWILRKAWFVRHRVRRENRVISRRTRAPCVRETR